MTRSQASSVETLNHDNKKSYSNNNNNSSSSNNSSNSTAEVQVDNIPKEKSKEGIKTVVISFRRKTDTL